MVVVFPLNVCKMAVLWVWFSFFQTQALECLLEFDRRWLHIYHDEFNSDHGLNKRNDLNKEKEHQSIEHDRPFLNFPTIPFLQRLKWIENIANEASEVGEVVSNFAQWIASACSKSFSVIIERQFNQQETTQETSALQPDPILKETPNSPPVSTTLSPLEVSPIWTPPIPGTTTTASTMKPNRSNAISELKLVSTTLPRHFLSHLKMCALLLQLKEQKSDATNKFKEEIFQIRKSLLLNDKAHMKFEHDLYVMVCSVAGSRLSLRTPSVLRIVPHKLPRAQPVDLKLIESLDVMSSSDFLKLLEKEGAPLVGALETALWHLKFCRSMASSIDSSITTGGFTSNQDSSLPILDEKASSHKEHSSSEDIVLTMEQILMKKESRATLRHRHMLRKEKETNATKQKEELTHNNDESMGTLVDDEDIAKFKSSLQKDGDESTIAYNKLLEALNHTTSFNIHIDLVVEMLFMSLLNTNSFHPNSSSTNRTALKDREFERVKTAMLRRLFAATRQIEVLDENNLEGKDMSFPSDKFQVSNLTKSDVKTTAHVIDETLSNGYIPIRAVVSVFMQLLLNPTSWCFNHTNSAKESVTFSKVKKVLGDFSDDHRSAMDVLNDIFSHKDAFTSPNRLHFHSLSQQSAESKDILKEIIMLLDVLKLSRRLLRNMETLLLKKSSRRHAQLNEISRYTESHNLQGGGGEQENLTAEHRRADTANFVYEDLFENKKLMQFMESLEPKWMNVIVRSMKPWVVSSNATTLLAKNDKTGEVSTVIINPLSKISPFSTALGNWNVNNAKLLDIQARADLKRENDLSNVCEDDKSVQGNESPIVQKESKEESDPHVHFNDKNLNSHLENIRSSPNSVLPPNIAEMLNLGRKKSNPEDEVYMEERELVKIVKNSIKSSLGKARSLEYGKWTIPRLDDAMESILQSATMNQFLSKTSTGSPEDENKNNYNIAKLNERIRNNIKIQIVLLKAIRLCLSSRVLFDANTPDNFNKKKSNSDIASMSMDANFYEGSGLLNENENKEPVSSSSALSSPLIRQLASIAVRCIKNHCLDIRSNVMYGHTSSDRQEEVPVLTMNTDLSEASELLRFSCQLLCELTQTPSTDLPKKPTEFNNSHSMETPYPLMNNLSNDSERQIAPYARGTRARLAAQAASKQAKLDNEARLAVTPASISYSSVAAIGGFAALADAMIAVDIACSNSANIDLWTEEEEDEEEEGINIAMLDGYADMKRDSPKIHRVNTDVSRLEEIEANREQLLEDWAEVRRCGLSVFGRHDILDTYDLRRFGGRRSLHACFSALKWTTREKWRNYNTQRRHQGLTCHVSSKVEKGENSTHGEGLSYQEAESHSGLALIATTHLLLRVAATDMLPLHVAVQEGDLNRIKAEIALRTNPEKWEEEVKGMENAADIPILPTPIGITEGKTSKQVSRMKFLDTAHWFFIDCKGLLHMKDACGVHGGLKGPLPGSVPSPALAAAGLWTIKTLSEHWPEFVDDGTTSGVNRKTKSTSEKTSHRHGNHQPTNLFQSDSEDTGNESEEENDYKKQATFSSFSSPATSCPASQGVAIDSDEDEFHDL